jgi:cation diffusion facilitator CzcD-associated flavoprotein CzcO
MRPMAGRPGIERHLVVLVAAGTGLRVSGAKHAGKALSSEEVSMGCGALGDPKVPRCPGNRQTNGSPLRRATGREP